MKTNYAARSKLYTDAEGPSLDPKKNQTHKGEDSDEGQC